MCHIKLVLIITESKSLKLIEVKYLLELVIIENNLNNIKLKIYTVNNPD